MTFLTFEPVIPVSMLPVLFGSGAYPLHPPQDSGLSSVIAWVAGVTATLAVPLILILIRARSRSGRQTPEDSSAVVSHFLPL